jgi:hypothetical protein
MNREKWANGSEVCVLIVGFKENSRPWLTFKARL